MRIIVFFLLALVASGYFLFEHWLSPQLRGPIRIGEELSAVQEEKLDMEKQAFTVTQAKLIHESDNRVVIRFSYKGNDPTWNLNACGDIKEHSMNGPWGCEPRVLQSNKANKENEANSPDQGSVDIGFVLANGAMVKGRERECSDTVSISVYGSDGSVFYRKNYALKKVWHRDPGMWSWYQYRHEGCPVRSPN